MVKFFILLSMIFFHIVDDYYLQGWLASAKQREWWKQNASDDLYKNDYIMALFMHSFSWSFSIMLIPTIYILIFGGFYDPFIFIANILIHMYVDDLKANEKKINLVTDQIIHIIQIVWTWLIMMKLL